MIMVASWRINFFVVVILALAGLIFYRLYFLAFQQHQRYVQMAEAQYQYRDKQTIRRGQIYLSDYQNGRPFLVATQKNVPFIYAIPRQSKDPETSAQQLSLALGLSLEKTREIFGKKDDPFEILISGPTPEQLEIVRNWPGKEVAIAFEETRYYPEGNFLGQVLGFLGFVGDKRQGQYGLEEYYDQILAGEEEEKTEELLVKKSSWLRSSKESNKTGIPKDGSSIVLSIDKNIQSFVQQELANLLDRWKPESGLIIVQDPRDGRILAMTGSPSYDPNYYNQSPLKSFVNKSVQEMFEPGSSFKPITMVAALDQKKITPETTYWDKGEVEIAGYKIRNFNEKSFGLQTMTQVLEKSLNTGAIFVEEQLGDENFLDYVLNFGFGQPTGIDLANEVVGDISNLYSKRRINFLTASFGQGIAVTPMQLINAYSALANDGKMFRPFVVQEIIRPNGERLVTKPELLSTPIKERAADQIKAMLVRVVENGFDKAGVLGYEVAGKTGTAQIASSTGGYSDEFIHNIIGFGPAFSPQFVVLIKIDKPQGVRFASSSLSPTLGKIMSFLFNYYGIPPTK